MDPRIITQNEETPLVVVVSSLITLCVLVATTLWMCWKLGRAVSSEMAETRDEDEYTGLDNSPLTTAKEPASLQQTGRLEKQDEGLGAVEDQSDS